MKKYIALLLAAIMCFSLCACGGSSNKKAFTAAQAAYNNIDDAYQIIEQFGSDIYEAWRLGIYDDDEDDFSLKYLSKSLSLSETELKTGFAYAVDKDKWDNMDDKEKKEAIDSAEAMFTIYTILGDNAFSACVEAVTCAYEVSGKTAEVQELLDEAKGQMKEMSDKYSDYEHYPSLKGYYTAANAFFNFCKNPTGSFEQVKTTINDYRNEARGYISDLDYIFED